MGLDVVELVMNVEEQYGFTIRTQMRERCAQSVIFTPTSSSTLFLGPTAKKLGTG
jgi:hypothetical protein